MPAGGALQLTPSKVKKKPQDIHFKMPGSSGVAARDLMLFTRQFSTMISSGLSLLRTLNILAEQSENPLLQKTIGAVRDDVERGSSLSASMSKHPKVFNHLFVADLMSHLLKLVTYIAVSGALGAMARG